MNDPLIDNLVSNLVPVKTYNKWQITALLLFGLMVFALFIVSHLGMREMAPAIKSGAIYWKNGGLVLSAILGFIAINNISRPENKNNALSLSAIYFTPIVVLLLSAFNFHSLMLEIKSPNFGGAIVCASLIFVLGSIMLSLVYTLFLRKAASSTPKLLGFISGIASGFVAASAYALHCNMDGFLYFIVCYLLPIATLGLIGLYIGIKKLTW